MQLAGIFPASASYTTDNRLVNKKFAVKGSVKSPADSVGCKKSFDD